MQETCLLKVRWAILFHSHFNKETFIVYPNNAYISRTMTNTKQTHCTNTGCMTN